MLGPATRCSIPGWPRSPGPHPIGGVDYPRTLPEFDDWFSSEAACLAFLRRVRWRQSFRCPQCAGSEAWLTNTGHRKQQIEAAPESVERFKTKVREIWRSCRSVTSVELRDEWRRWVIGWWGYYRLAEDRRAIFRLEGWIRRHIRQCFWLRWQSVRGRCRALRRLGAPEQMLRYVPTRRGEWHVAAQRMMHTALSNATLRRHGFVMPSDLAAP